MKKLIVMLVLAFVALAASAQVGRVNSTTDKTIVNTATVTSDIITLSGTYKSLAIQTVYTQVGGTTSGTATVMGSVDGTSYVTLTSADGLVKNYPADTYAVTSASIHNTIIENPAWKYYKVVSIGLGTATTTVTTKYIYK